jgi:hypothetical protein
LDQSPGGRQFCPQLRRYCAEKKNPAKKDESKKVPQGFEEFYAIRDPGKGRAANKNAGNANAKKAENVHAKEGVHETKKPRGMFFKNARPRVGYCGTSLIIQSQAGRWFRYSVNGHFKILPFRSNADFGPGHQRCTFITPSVGSDPISVKSLAKGYNGDAHPPSPRQCAQQRLGTEV